MGRRKRTREMFIVFKIRAPALTVTKGGRKAERQGHVGTGYPGV